ncbi:hypothetical protein SAMN03159341_102178 [Paenibacillus sp. 1_12]|uniref:hypothetical protein n=1 Tax=Paenibacillus sp. 1_12 TaxID=1566278 RepID=UPI0008F07AFA|nr:hypothetical protein [Paenibacillus sp. 1_12]SFK92437.1 hypothetical protein SAMN03159341_102178 [Paenibacillus sp. 1_12]
MSSSINSNHQAHEDTAPLITDEDDTFLPPRKVVHPGESDKWLRIFYLSLLWVFILLVAGLLIWGWQRVKGEA